MDAYGYSLGAALALGQMLREDLDAFVASNQAGQ